MVQQVLKPGLIVHSPDQHIILPHQDINPEKLLLITLLDWARLFSTAIVVGSCTCSMCNHDCRDGCTWCVPGLVWMHGTKFCEVHCCRCMLAFHHIEDSMKMDFEPCQMVTAPTHEATFVDICCKPKTPPHGCAMIPGLGIFP